jgi:phage baseplate assembly protein W
MARTLALPFQIGGLGTPRTANRTAGARQQLEQLLFTLPGERVNRPDFGCGVQRLVFSGASPEAAAVTEYAVRVAIRRFLSDILSLDAVKVTVDDVTLTVDILYTLVDTGEELADTFKRPLEAPP